ncbi:MAG: glycoside hydrolase family 5 protein [Ilumatobacter sp.]
MNNDQSSHSVAPASAFGRRRPTWPTTVGAVGAAALLSSAATIGFTDRGVPDSTAAVRPATAVEPTSPLDEDDHVVSTVAARPGIASSPGTGTLDGRWSTSGSGLVDADGDPVHIRGVNWFGFETANGAPHGLWQRNLDEMLDQIAELGFNTIRLPFAAEMLDADTPVQGIDQNSNPDLQGLSSLEVMDVFIERAGARGLAIILDRHALGFDDRHHLWFDERFAQDRLIEDWELLGERYGDAPNVIGADLYNEPHDEACWGCGDPSVDWKLAAEQATDALHAVEPDWLVFIEGVEESDGASCDGPESSDSCTWWGGNLSAVLDKPIDVQSMDKVVYSPHEYATSVFRQPWFDDPSFPANMPAIWDRFWGEIETSGTAPVMVGEFGTTLDSEVDAVWLETLMRYLADNDIGFTFWTFNPNSGDTGGILEDDWVTVDAAKLSFLQPHLVGPFPPVP